MVTKLKLMLQVPHSVFGGAIESKERVVMEGADMVDLESLKIAMESFLLFLEFRPTSANIT